MLKKLLNIYFSFVLSHNLNWLGLVAKLKIESCYDMTFICMVRVFSKYSFKFLLTHTHSFSNLCQLYFCVSYCYFILRIVRETNKNSTRSVQTNTLEKMAEIIDTVIEKNIIYLASGHWTRLVFWFEIMSLCFYIL